MCKGTIAQYIPLFFTLYSIKKLTKRGKGIAVNYVEAHFYVEFPCVTKKVGWGGGRQLKKHVLVTHFLHPPSKGVSFSHCKVQLCEKISRGNIVYAPLPDSHQSIFGFRTSFSYFGFTRQCSGFFLFRILLICPD